MTPLAKSKSKRVLVGLSGGVDSSVAAALLQSRGYEAIGATLRLWSAEGPARAEGECRRTRAAADAEAVCKKLGIPFHYFDESDFFRENIVGPFIEEYRAGRTPNVCVLCNQQVKFGRLMQKALELGADYLATGHYARVRRDTASGRNLLERARDPKKDQSYFLFALSQQQLERVAFPLGDLTKDEVRGIARELSLPTAERQESMEICFVPGNDYGAFLRQTGVVQAHEGEVVSIDGKVLGRHEGVEFYTIGQRRGLRIAAGKPIYVVALDPVRNRVVVGDNSDLLRNELAVVNCNWIAFGQPSSPFEARVKIRHNHPGTDATLTPTDGGEVRVKLHVPQRAITPGQACVFYQGDTVVGGGWIAR